MRVRPFQSLGVAVLALFSGAHPSTGFFLGGAISYFVGTFLVTMFGNVPLNDRLAAVSATDPGAARFWIHYLKRWTTWNHIRTVAAMVAARLYTLGLMQNVNM